jgi:hypothetical protein
MALFIYNKEITQIVSKNKPISTVYKAGVIVWQAVRSCFGGGLWISKKPWLGKEGWKLGKRN